MSADDIVICAENRWKRTWRGDCIHLKEEDQKSAVARQYICKNKKEAGGTLKLQGA